MILNKKIKQKSIILVTSLMLGFLNIGYVKGNISFTNIANANSNITYNKTTFKEVSVGKGKYAYIRSSGTVYKDNIIGKLSNGEVVEVVRETSNWYRVKKGNIEGWVSKTEMKDTNKKANINSWYYKTDESDITIKKTTFKNKEGKKSDVYIANVKIKNAMQFKHVYANNDLNAVNTVENMTKKHNALIAINASGFLKDNTPSGSVGSKGKIDLFRKRKVSSSLDYSSLLLDYQGNLKLKNANKQSDLENLKPFWVATFGPTLVNNSKVQVTTANVKPNTSEAEPHPRMAIGQKGNPNEFIIICVDGRSSQSYGVTLPELASLFEKEKCKVAYNLDGGGSATLMFDGYVINKPSDDKGPRKVIDSLFIRDIR